MRQSKQKIGTPDPVAFSGAVARVQWSLLRAYAAAARLIGSHRGIHRVAWLLDEVVENTWVMVDLGRGERLKIEVGDGYWMRMLLGVPYEVAVHDVLAQELGPDVPLLDCGANIGYWSVLGSRRWGASVLAVEPSLAVYRQLQRNNILNGSPFNTLRSAIWSSDDQELTLVSHPLRHAGGSVVNRRERIGFGRYTTEVVRTTTIDTLVEEHFSQNRRIVVKLDVEGAEGAALAGAAKTLREKEVVLLYEDTDGAVSDRVRALGLRTTPMGDGNHLAERR